MLLLLLACASDDEPVPVGCSDCALTDANNFAYEPDLTVAVESIAAEQDARIGWETLDRDLEGHRLDPAEIDSAQLVAFRDLTPDEVAWGLAHDTLDQVAVTLFLTCTPTDAGCSLSDFGVLGTPFDLVPRLTEGAATWLLVLKRGDSPGAAGLVFLDPRADEPVHDVAITDDTSRLDVDVDLQSLTPVRVHAGGADITVEWSGLAHDGLGNDLDLDDLDTVLLARYDLDVPSLEEHVFDLEDIAVETWTGDVAGTRSVALDAFADGFAGIDASDVWLLALECSTCTNPAPRFVTRLEVAP